LALLDQYKFAWSVGWTLLTRKQN